MCELGVVKNVKNVVIDHLMFFFFDFFSFFFRLFFGNILKFGLDVSKLQTKQIMLQLQSNVYFLSLENVENPPKIPQCHTSPPIINTPTIINHMINYMINPTINDSSYHPPFHPFPQLLAHYYQSKIPLRTTAIPSES